MIALVDDFNDGTLDHRCHEALVSGDTVFGTAKEDSEHLTPEATGWLSGRGVWDFCLPY